MARTSASLMVILAAAGLAAGVSVRAVAPHLASLPQSPSSSPDLLAEMRHHFAQVGLIHNSLTRGDLAAIREPATQLSRTAVPVGLPDAAGSYVAAIRQAASRVVAATTLASAATATVSMLTQCGDCHRAVGVFPAPTIPKRPDVGGLVGEMLEHQRATDDMLVGLIVPSASQWRQGAERLTAAKLLSSKLPPDPKLTQEIRTAEVRVHQIAKQAETAADASARGVIYAQLLTTCAQCHSLHKSVWGPGKD
jgi:mono/diheme cytochrome c family protein